jgi:hypothetical protein
MPEKAGGKGRRGVHGRRLARIRALAGELAALPSHGLSAAWGGILLYQALRALLFLCASWSSQPASGR